MDDVIALTKPDDIDRVLADEVAVVYKHSPICGVSTAALREVRRFMAAHPSVPVYMVDVVVRRDVSRRVADITGIPHHSPQVIVFRGGRPVWNADHFGVTQKALSLALES